MRASSTLALGDLDASATQPDVAGRSPARLRSPRPPRTVLGLLLDDGARRLLHGASPSSATRRSSTRASCSRTATASTKRRWPPLDDRLASDLLRPGDIEDPWLRQITRRALEATDPDAARRPHAGRAAACRCAGGRAREWTRDAGRRTSGARPRAPTLLGRDAARSADPRGDRPAGGRSRSRGSWSWRSTSRSTATTRRPRAGSGRRRLPDRARDAPDLRRRARAPGRGHLAPRRAAGDFTIREYAAGDGALAEAILDASPRTSPPRGASDTRRSRSIRSVPRRARARGSAKIRPRCTRRGSA